MARIVKSKRRDNKLCRAPRVRLGVADGRVTPRAGLHLVAKLNQLLGISAAIDAAGSPIKSRRRGLGVGSLMLALAEMMLAGGDFFCDLDTQRKDAAGARLRAVAAIPASSTAIGLGKRFDDSTRQAVERANAELVGSAFAMVSRKRRQELRAQRPTIDLDPTDVEVYGKNKNGSAYNYQGQRTYRPHPAVWAETGWCLAGDLGSGRDDPRPQAPSLIARAVSALPGGLLRAIVRGDSGFFDAAVAWASLANGADFAIAAKRNSAVWRAERAIPKDAWVPAKDMEAEVAECDYVPAGWPPGTRTICRRVKVNADDLSSDTRSRRRRTIDAEQLRLLELGEADFAYAYSFIVCNLQGDIVKIEAWFRRRALVEEKIKDSKLGLALRHMPSGYEAVNAMWMWAALIGLNISSWLQALTGHDLTGGRAHGKRLRRELICVPARVTSHAGDIVVHAGAEDTDGAFGLAWECLDSLLAAGP